MGYFPLCQEALPAEMPPLGKDALGDSSSLDHMVPVGIHLSYVLYQCPLYPATLRSKWMLDGPTLRLSGNRYSDTSTTTETLMYQDVIQSYLANYVRLYSISYTSTGYSSPNNNRP
ncbi:hypothetical protein POX_a01634 [Penicillium oxalicum]|uniref:hypothetical protein n=1 Tax=Penicillium oxalicum TaxID=69781 RepID=UPI0020B87184|nr:hypothetical protein POX_a01634 [Penicillium oxalicum]KAI2795031.1 hypothetical protein POX_a01634 [Penicillium oxalicum]